MASWYVNFGNGTSTGYYAVAQWAALTAYSVGDLRRQLATPAVGSERVFRCTTAGTSLASEPTWVLTAGATTTESAGPVWTEVTGNATYNWTAPHARLANAFASGWGAAGDTFYVSHAHAETQASAMTLTSPQASGSFRTLCVNSAGTVPPVSADLRTTATITTTGAFGITVNYGYYNGFTFNAGSGAVANGVVLGSAQNGILTLENCNLNKLGTTAGTALDLPTPGGILYLKNTKLQFGATGDTIKARSGNAFWSKTPSAIAGATFPTNLFIGSGAGTSCVIELDSVDLSALGSGKNIVANFGSGPAQIYLNRCKLGASVVVAAAQTNQGGPTVYLTNCDSAATNYRHEKYSYSGSQVVETTIVRTGGASIKGTSIAWKGVTTANSSLIHPFDFLPIVIPDNEIIGTAVTITVQGIWGGGAVPLNDEIWMDCQYFGDSASPQGSFATSGKADILATGANLSAGSGTWGGSTTKFQMSVTITPQIKGPITLYVKAAKASSTFYIDPKPLVT